MAVEQAVAESPLFAGNEMSILRDGAQTFPKHWFGEGIHTAQVV
jgi:hypothetical protein